MAKNSAPVVKSHTERYTKPKEIGLMSNNGGMTMGGLRNIRFLSAKSYNLEENVKSILKKIPEHFKGDAKITVYSGQEHTFSGICYICLGIVEPIMRKLSGRSTIHWSVEQRKKLGKKYTLCVTLGRR